MTLWLHSVIFATALAAAAGVASAAYFSVTDSVAIKSDRLVWVDQNAAPEYVTIEQRAPGISVLTRLRTP
jgi:hypothetical protein